MPEAHAERSPSAAEKWFNCPGSLCLEEGLPRKSSAYAGEGTMAHSLAEALLNGGVFDATEEMREHVMVYVNHVDELSDHPDAVCQIEQKVTAAPGCWGTADAIVWRPDQATLYVRDLKYGAGVGVEVRGNLQLKIYALGALLTSKFPAQTVNVGIVQPRFGHPDGHIRSVDFDALDLIDFHADLVDAAKRTEAARVNFDLYKKFRKSTKPLEMAAVKEWEDKYLKPTEKGCRWCLAAPTCPKVAGKAQELAKVAFALQSYDPQELAKALDFLPILEGWIKNTREFAYEEAEKGNAIPGYKLVPKQATRKFKPGVEEDMAKALGVDRTALYGQAPLLGVTEIQKLAPGKNDKERAAVLEPFVVKESSGHTLVHESDKRDAIRVDAKAAFAPLS